MHIVFFGFGTNLGNRFKYLYDAIEACETYIGSCVEKSSIYVTEPWGVHGQADYWNMVAKFSTKLSAVEILTALQKIEISLGRKRTTQWAARTIDIDILFYNNEVLHLQNPPLQIPHPLLQNRNFVLAPLAEISPNFIHPILQLPICKLLETSTDKGKIELLLM